MFSKKNRSTTLSRTTIINPPDFKNLEDLRFARKILISKSYKKPASSIKQTIFSL